MKIIFKELIFNEEWIEEPNRFHIFSNLRIYL